MEREALLPTLLTLLAGAVFLILWDVRLARKSGYEGTISYQVLTFSERHPIAPFLFGMLLGILCGHLFWSQ
jgi:hypothetical protein